ncbi:hypothetical protein QQ045_011163 [Rhodiola kirilowii]
MEESILGTTLTDALTSCAQSLKEWNNSTYGKVEKRIDAIKEKLGNLKNCVRTKGVVDEEQNLSEELDEWLARKDFLWRQRSRVEWLREGDQNTSFFHANASHRRQINRIDRLKKENTEATEEGEIVSMVEDYFSDLFKSRQDLTVSELSSYMDVIPEVVTDEMRRELRRPYSVEEIKKAVFQMAPTKAPGLDGFPALFYQKHWNLVGDYLCREVLRYLNESQLHRRINLTRIALIPKCKNAIKIEDFRPICVSNTSIKVISKVLVNRLQSLLPQVISHSHSAFVKHRLISDNILIAHEIGHFIKTRKENQEKILTLKLDMSKAYDRVEWNFLRAVLVKLGFPKDWIDLVMRIVCSVVYNVRVNDLFTNDIVPGRSLRQGDPLSPYLFIMCAEWLSRSLDERMLNKRLTGIQIARNAPSVSHLFFADDSLVYLRAELAEVRELKEVLSKYGKKFPI